MNCALCGCALSFEDPVFLYRLGNDFLVFCSSCEGDLTDPDEIQRLVELL